jgi:hypothetical protein
LENIPLPRVSYCFAYQTWHFATFKTYLTACPKILWLHSTLHTLDRQTLHSSHHTPHFSLYTAPIIHTLYTTLFHLKRHTPHSTRQTPHFSPRTLHSSRYTLDFIYTLHITLYTPHSTPQSLLFTPHTLQPTILSSQSTFLFPHTPHSTLSTPHFKLATEKICTKLLKINYCRKIFYVITYPCFLIYTIIIYASIRVCGRYFFFRLFSCLIFITFTFHLYILS